MVESFKSAPFRVLGRPPQTAQRVTSDQRSHVAVNHNPAAIQPSTAHHPSGSWGGAGYDDSAARLRPYPHPQQPLQYPSGTHHHHQQAPYGREGAGATAGAGVGIGAQHYPPHYGQYPHPQPVPPPYHCNNSPQDQYCGGYAPASSSSHGHPLPYPAPHEHNSAPHSRTLAAAGGGNGDRASVSASAHGHGSAFSHQPAYMRSGSSSLASFGNPPSYDGAVDTVSLHKELYRTRATITISGGMPVSSQPYAAPPKVHSSRPSAGGGEIYPPLAYTGAPAAAAAGAGARTTTTSYPYASSCALPCCAPPHTHTHTHTAQSQAYPHPSQHQPQQQWLSASSAPPSGPYYPSGYGPSAPHHPAQPPPPPPPQQQQPAPVSGARADHQSYAFHMPSEAKASGQQYQWVNYEYGSSVKEKPKKEVGSKQVVDNCGCALPQCPLNHPSQSQAGKGREEEARGARPPSVAAPSSSVPPRQADPALSANTASLPSQGEKDRASGPPRPADAALPATTGSLLSQGENDGASGPPRPADAALPATTTGSLLSQGEKDRASAGPPAAVTSSSSSSANPFAQKGPQLMAKSLLAKVLNGGSGRGGENEKAASDVAAGAPSQTPTTTTTEGGADHSSSLPPPSHEGSENGVQQGQPQPNAPTPPPPPHAREGTTTTHGIAGSQQPQSAADNNSGSGAPLRASETHGSVVAAAPAGVGVVSHQPRSHSQQQPPPQPALSDAVAEASMSVRPAPLAPSQEGEPRGSEVPAVVGGGGGVPVAVAVPSRPPSSSSATTAVAAALEEADRVAQALCGDAGEEKEKPAPAVVETASLAQGAIGVWESVRVAAVVVPEEPKRPVIDRTKRPFKKHYKVMSACACAFCC